MDLIASNYFSDFILCDLTLQFTVSDGVDFACPDASVVHTAVACHIGLSRDLQLIEHLLNARTVQGPAAVQNAGSA